MCCFKAHFNSCAPQVMDFYWSDPRRQKWDNMLTKAEILENGEFSQREMVVHWVRSFPFSFLSDRDYVIGRREFQRGQVLYGITKVINYPQHDPGKLVQTDKYWSMWSCEPVSCPYNTGARCHRHAHRARVPALSASCHAAVRLALRLQS